MLVSYYEEGKVVLVGEARKQRVGDLRVGYRSVQSVWFLWCTFKVYSNLGSKVEVRVVVRS